MLTSTSSPIPSRVASLTPDLRLPPDRWQEWPVVPEIISPRMLEIYQAGLVLGNNPRAFSKIGDGEASTVWFLTPYDLGPAYYNLGVYTDLQPVIEYFAGSFGRTSLAAGRGFNTSIILDPAFANKLQCDAGESPLECELRSQHPSFAFLSLGTNQVWYPETFATELRIIVERLLATGVVPILSTKADNLEGDNRINQIIANMANEYDLPLWNFWRAVQPLPDHGLQADLEHLSWASPYFDELAHMQMAWPWRNLTALQVIDVVYRNLTEQP
ncbi:MAG TPA: hypothetical protein VF359_02095 [Anaerolineales bacterium]